MWKFVKKYILLITGRKRGLILFCTRLELTRSATREINQLLSARAEVSLHLHNSCAQLGITWSSRPPSSPQLGCYHPLLLSSYFPWLLSACYLCLYVDNLPGNFLLSSWLPCFLGKKTNVFHSKVNVLFIILNVLWHTNTEYQKTPVNSHLFLSCIEQLTKQYK